MIFAATYNRLSNADCRKKLLSFLSQLHLAGSSHIVRDILAITTSRVDYFAKESATKTAMAKCRPFGSITKPISLVAPVITLTVPDVPVLCATVVPAGKSPFSRLAPVGDSIISFSNNAWLCSESLRFLA